MDHLEILKQFDWSLEPELLRDIYKKSNFDKIFIQLINKNVIGTLSPQLYGEPYNLVYDDEVIYKQLLGPLEQATLFTSNLAASEDNGIEKTFKYLQTLNEPSKLCRKILKAGDVTFSCYDCGLDSTCVLCIDCFHKSAHKDHNYRMSNSDGGGCCDCGDGEAWKQNYACSDHISADHVELKLSDFEDKELRTKHIIADKKRLVEKISQLPEGLAARYFVVCQAALHYARTLLTCSDQQILFDYLDLNELDDPLLSTQKSSKNYFTVLFNDEVHTYDHVINTLVRIVKCSRMTASIMASTVSREGRSFVFNDDKKNCSQIRDLIKGVRDGVHLPLKVETIHGAVLAHQAFAIKLIGWIKKMSSLCDAFRALTAFTLMGTYDCITETTETAIPNMTLIEKVMLTNTRFWKIARIEWNDLFVQTMLIDYSIKERFARSITRQYPKLMELYVQDDHDYSVSTLTLTTQLYTVPSLVSMLIEEENALAILMQTLISTCQNTKRHNILTFENRNTFDMHALKRALYTISDLRHLINIGPTKWTCQLRENVLEAVRLFLELLTSMQGMDSVKRQLGQHIEYEPDWESGMTLQSRLTFFISKLITYCSLDENVLVQSLRETQLKLLKISSYKMVTKDLFDYSVSCIQYDVSTSPVSVHLPLTRFAAALIVELMSRRLSNKVPYDESLVLLTNENNEAERRQSMIDIMEPSLRTEVMIAQFRSGMWRRNGYSLVNQILYFHGASMRKEMFDRDILVLQECAAMYDPNEFMIHLLNKFNLLKWIDLETLRDVAKLPIRLSNDEILAQTMSLGEEFLQLLLTIVGERYRVGVGKVAEEDVIKNEIIQLLCISPTTRSDLTQKLFVNDTELDCIKSVANLKRSTDSSTGKYELKEEFYDRFNPFFYHYTRRHQSNALDAQLKRKKILKEPLLCCPPPRPVELTIQFKNLNELLKCDITLLLIQKILMRVISMELEEDAEAIKASDLQLDQCLHLIGLGLFEQEKNPEEFIFLEAAWKKDIFKLLRQLYNKTERSKDLILWLMKKVRDDIFPCLPKSVDEAMVVCINKSIEEPLVSCNLNKQNDKKKNSELAAQRRERIMAMMKSNQEKFLTSANAKQLASETEKNESKSDTKKTSQTIQPSTSGLHIYVTRSGRKTKPPKSISSSFHDKQPSSIKKPEEAIEMDCDSNDDETMEEFDGQADINHLCILCRDEQKVGFKQPTMVLLAYIQRSAVLSKNRSERRIPNYALTPSNQLKYLSTRNSQSAAGSSSSPNMYSFTSDNSWSFDATFMPSDLFFGPHISSCGHVMHYDCWQGFFDAISRRETSRPNRNTRHVSFELEKNEILCPLCECISNATIPLLSNYTKFSPRKSATIFSSSPETILRSPDNLSACLHALRGTVDMFKHIRHIKEVSTNISINFENKYIKLLQPKNINEVLEELKEVEALGLRDFINSIRTDKILSSNCTKSLLNSISTLAERIHCVGLDLDNSVTDINHARIFMMTSWSISYTIQAHERCSRFKGTPILEDQEFSRNLCLNSLIRFACSSMMTHQSDMIQSLLVRKLRYLLITDEYLSSSPCCLDIDAFETFVSLMILLQKLYAHIDDASQVQSQVEDGKTASSTSEDLSSANGANNSNYAWTTIAYDHEYFRNILHLMFILNSIQVLVSMHNEFAQKHIVSSANDMDGEDEYKDSKEGLMLKNLYQDMILASGHPCCSMPAINEKFSVKFKNRLLPFLRSASIFFHHLSNIQPPEMLKTKTPFFEGETFLQESSNSRSIDDYLKTDETNSEFAAICYYLDLPEQFDLLYQSQEARHLTKAWLRHSRVLLLIKSDVATTTKLIDPNPSHTELMPVNLIRQPHMVNRLTDLPSDYSELVDKVSDFTCPTIKNEDSRTPTMCLICGVMFCSQSYCCQRDLNDLASQSNPLIQQQLVGSCTYHAYECSGGVGVFLRIRNSQILLLSGKNKGCYMPAPYIDDHGETDFGLMRGNPLHLDRRHYEKLQNMWLNHSIPEQISRTLEYSPYMSSINWYLH